MRVVLLSSGGDGQQNDVQMLDQLLREWNLRNGGKAVTSIDRLDPVTFLNPSRPPQCVDLQIHIETPCRAAMPWARCNIVLVNPEWWPATAWNWALAPPAKGGADLFLFRSAHGRSLFPDIEAARAQILPWRAPAAARSAWTDVMRHVRGTVTRAARPALPPAPLPPADLPVVAVVTLTRNRRRWFANMVRNILMAGYPRERLAWVIVDDGDEGQRIDAEVQRFQTSHPEVRVVYLTTGDAATLGEKRNRGVAAAPADCSVILMMDDDDHYPAGSIARRVAWMTALGVDCVYCSTLPMYHCGKYISAYNTPPLDLAPEERVSEATLCFRRAFWAARGFPAESDMAEGTGFLAGRLEHTADIHPAGIIVSFLHGANATSRRVPASAEPNGCHYGFDDDYFLYLSDLATDSV